MTKMIFNFQNTYMGLPEAFYCKLGPRPVSAPKMVVLNEELARAMGLDFSHLSPKEQADFFAGNAMPQGAEPLAQAYAGHQFGHFTMLGDGRAVVWGEHVTQDGRRLDIQSKGSGRTPYARQGDGRAALGPMLREYIISESMFALGVPTTRSLAVVTTGENVFRETVLPGAILTRVAASHIRVGTFEFAAAHGGKAMVIALLDYTIDRHEPDLNDTDNKALAFLCRVMERQADLIVHWMRVGFIHGVMNTDNMALSGETIDYGPCAFMDAYDPKTVLSSIDHRGRYAYANQPIIAQWNIARLAEALLFLIDEDINKAVGLATDTINQFSALYKDKWYSMMRTKLGMFGIREQDETLISNFMELMEKYDADYTNTFRALAQEEKISGSLYQSREFDKWHQRWHERLKQNSKPLRSSLCLMRNANPAVIPRNHQVEKVLEATNKGDFMPFQDLLAALKSPYADHENLNPYKSPPRPDERVCQTFCGT